MTEITPDAPPVTAEQIVAENLRVELARRRITGRQFAELSGWPQATVARRLRGMTSLTFAEYLDAVAVLDLPFGALLDGGVVEQRAAERRAAVTAT